MKNEAAGMIPRVRSRPNTHGALCAAVLTGIFSFGPVSIAQEDTTATQPATAPAASQPAATQPVATTQVAPIGIEDSALTIEWVEDRIRQVEKATNLDEAAKTRIIAIYQQSREHLRGAKSFEAKTSEIERARDEVPERLRQVREELEKRTSTQPATAPATQPEMVEADLTGQTLAQTEQRLVRLEAERTAAQSARNALSDEAKLRSARQASIPDLLADLTKQLETIRAEVQAPVKEDGARDLALAERNLTLARKKAIEQEIKFNETELRSFETRNELLSIRRELARLAYREANQRFKRAEAAVRLQRKADIEKQKEVAARELEQSAAPVREIARENKKLAEERASCVQKIEDAEQSRSELEDRLEFLDQQFRVVQNHVTARRSTTPAGSGGLEETARRSSGSNHRIGQRAFAPCGTGRARR
jgi:DNA repair exonuclease SbcCD ATPase subunit